MTLSSFIKKRPYLVWYVQHPAGLSPAAIVESVLNYGDWEDVQRLLKILGPKKVARIFRKKSKPLNMGRSNYRPEIANYFKLFFNKYA